MSICPAPLERARNAQENIRPTVSLYSQVLPPPPSYLPLPFRDPATISPPALPAVPQGLHVRAMQRIRQVLEEQDARRQA